MNKGMTKVSVLYPNGKGKKFDMDYYCGPHVKMVIELLGEALKGASIESGIAGGLPGSPAPFLAIANMYFTSVEEFENSFGPNADKILGDAPNFTNVEPIIQISEVMV